MRAAPVTAGERIFTLDLIRGCAVLGILLVNVWSYGLSFPPSLNPHFLGFDTLGNRLVHGLVFLVAYTKAMPIFAMLFGAGVALFAERQEKRGVQPGWPFVKRQFWLLVFGLVHAYLIWNGDILVPYATTGLVVYLLRNRSRRTLIILAVLAMLLPKVGAQSGAYFMEKMQTEAVAAREAEATGEDLTPAQMRALDQWDEIGPSWNPAAEDLAETRAIMTGPHWALVAHFAPETLMMHLFMYPLVIGWNIGGFMLLGMVLHRSGILTGQRSGSFYRRMAALGYGLGVPLSLLALWFFYHHFDFIAMVRWGFPLMNISGPLVAIGHMALLCLAWQNGWWVSAQARLMAAGRMAFTNYLTQTLICGGVFFGYGLGLFGTWNRPALLGLTLAVWALQLWWSTWWLDRFCFGPLEWVWRSLSYGRRPPLRR